MSDLGSLLTSADCADLASNNHARGPPNPRATAHYVLRRHAVQPPCSAPLYLLSCLLPAYTQFLHPPASASASVACLHLCHRSTPTLSHPYKVPAWFTSRHHLTASVNGTLLQSGNGARLPACFCGCEWRAVALLLLWVVLISDGLGCSGIDPRRCAVLWGCEGFA